MIRDYPILSSGISRLAKSLYYGEPLEVESASLQIQESKCSASGKIFSGATGLVLEIYSSESLFSLKSGVYGAADFGLANGILRGDIKFDIRGLHPPFRTNTRNNYVSGYRSNFAQFSFEKLRFANRSKKGKVRSIYGQLTKLPLTFFGELQQVSISGGPVEFSAEVEEANTLSLELNDCAAFLTKDLFDHTLFHFLLKFKSARSQDQAEDSMYCFLRAIGLCCGFECYPRLFSTENETIFRDNSKLRKCQYQSLDTSLFYQHRAGRSQMECLYSMFKVSGNRKLLTQLAHAFLRSTDSSLDLQARLLCICATLESLIGALYDNLIKADDSRQQQEDLFNLAKLNLTKLVFENKSLFGEFGEQACNYANNFKMLTSRNQYKYVMERTGIGYGKRAKDLFKTWGDERHPMAHSFGKEGINFDSTSRMMINSSRLAGFILELFLRTAGYQGHYKQSVFEGKYGKI